MYHRSIKRRYQYLTFDGNGAFPTWLEEYIAVDAVEARAKDYLPPMGTRADRAGRDELLTWLDLHIAMGIRPSMVTVRADTKFGYQGNHTIWVEC